jgi:hypothetical protein
VPPSRTRRRGALGGETPVRGPDARRPRAERRLDRPVPYGITRLAPGPEAAPRLARPGLGVDERVVAHRPRLVGPRVPLDERFAVVEHAPAVAVVLRGDEQAVAHAADRPAPGERERHRRARGSLARAPPTRGASRGRRRRATPRGARTAGLARSPGCRRRRSGACPPRRARGTGPRSCRRRPPARRRPCAWAPPRRVGAWAVVDGPRLEGCCGAVGRRSDTRRSTEQRPWVGPEGVARSTSGRTHGRRSRGSRRRSRPNVAERSAGRGREGAASETPDGPAVGSRAEPGGFGGEPRRPLRAPALPGSAMMDALRITARRVASDHHLAALGLLTVLVARRSASAASRSTASPPRRRRSTP